MPGTLTIALAILQPGSFTFGPAPLADTDSIVTLTISRDVTSGGTSGFNGQPAAVTAVISIDQSADGGETWEEIAFATIVGGTYTIHGGLPKNTDDVGTYLRPGTGRQGRATVVLTGAPVAVQGSLAIT